MINLREDSFFTGIVIGGLLPVVLYFIIAESFSLADKSISDSTFEKLQLFLFAVNAVIMRQFMVKRGQDNIGKGILLVTMLMVLAHFIYYYTSLL
jgi:hypothetical protein